MVLERILKAKDIIRRKIPEAFCPIGYENKGLSWEIVIDMNGKTVGPFIPCGESSGEKTKKTKKTKKVNGFKNVPLPWNKRSNEINPRVLADQAKYILELVDEKNPKAERAERLHASFIDLTRECFEKTRSDDVRAVLRFLESGSWEKELEAAVENGLLSDDVMTFRIDGHPDLIIESDDVMRFWATRSIETEDVGTCLLCGEKGAICRTHPIRINGVPGPSGGGDLISFNRSSTWSYDKQQSLNSPVCPSCAMDYARVLNALLKSGDHCVKFEDSAIVAWGEEQDFNPRMMDIRNPSAGSSSFITNMIDSPWRGKPVPGEVDEMFNIIDMMRGRRQSRIVIRGYRRERIHVIRERITRFFEASRICDWSENIDDKFHGLFELAIACCKDGDSGSMGEKIKRVFEGRFLADWFSAIVMGNAFPSRRLMSAMLGRVKAGDRFDRKRAALGRLLINQKGDVMPVALDESIKDPAYLLGRFFSIVEFMQKERGGVSSTIAKQYLNEMMNRPQRAFSNLAEMSVKYASQMSDGKRVNYEKIVLGITEGLSVSDIPRTFTDEQRVTFLLGRYHQDANVWKGRVKNKEATAPEEETE